MVRNRRQRVMLEFVDTTLSRQLEELLWEWVVGTSKYIKDEAVSSLGCKLRRIEYVGSNLYKRIR